MHVAQLASATMESALSLDNWLELVLLIPVSLSTSLVAKVSLERSTS